MRIHHPFILELLLLASLSSSGQTFKFRHYSEQDGLDSKYIYTINQDQTGLLVLGTSEGIYSYDGFTFTRIISKDSAADNLVNCSYQSAEDNRIFFGYNSGNVNILRKNQLESLRLSATFHSKVTAITEDDNKNIWIVSQNGGIVFIGSNGRPSHLTKGLEEYNILSAASEGEHSIWLGTDQGIAFASMQKDSSMVVEFLDGFPITNVTDMWLATDGRLLVATEDAGAFVIRYDLKEHPYFPVQCFNFNLTEKFIKEIREDKAGNLWIGTNRGGLYKLIPNALTGVYDALKYSEKGKDEVQSIRCSFHDREENLWIGTVGEGLQKLENDFFVTYNPGEQEDKMISSVFEAKDTLWMGGFGKIFCLLNDTQNITEIIDQKNGLPEDQIISFLKDEDNNVYVGTAASGLWKMKSGLNKFKRIAFSDDILDLRINALHSFENKLYLATEFGIYILQNDEVQEHLSIQNGLASNVTRSFFRDSKNRIWIASTTSELSYLENNIIKKYVTPLLNSSIPVCGFAEDQQGTIWMATEGMGVVSVTSPDIHVYQKQDGLFSDYCYSVICDDRNRIWVGHRGAASRIDIQTQSIKILAPGEVGEVYFEDNAVMRLAGGSLIFGTNSGIVRYDQEKDKTNLLEPKLIVKSIRISDNLIENVPLIHLKYGDYKIEIEFVGISLRNPEEVTYRYFLEGYDNEWSAPTYDRVLRYHHLGPGDYKLKIKCYNADGVGGEHDFELVITIEKPFWQTPWFIILCAIISFLLIRYIVIRRERFFKQNQEYLKKELAERTKEVVHQKELLEIKNKDITDSILYAKNIQKAMLPPIDSLKIYFKNAFVFFKPRDIVSGDFYWVKQTENIVRVACADCTGHGVPGAFMSLIGSILLKDVQSNRDYSSPSSILVNLDHELYELLNKKTEGFSVNDGMDITLMEFDTETYKVRIASANRPVIIYHNSERIELRGDRHALGAPPIAGNSVSFTQHEMQLQPGDQIYLFSDGYVDQFGGPFSKKLKKVAFKRILDEASLMPMSEQLNFVRSKFNDWKGNHQQLDDVIVIGIQV